MFFEASCLDLRNNLLLCQKMRFCFSPPLAKSRQLFLQTLLIFRCFYAILYWCHQVAFKSEKRRLSLLSDNFIFFMEKYSSGDVCEHCQWQSKRAIMSGSRRRARANEFAKCDAVTATGSKRRDSKTNQLRHTLFPQALATSGFYGIGAQKCQAVGIQFSIKIPTIEYLEEYSSGRRGVTRNLVGR